MVFHLISISAFFLWATLLICGHLAVPNPQFQMNHDFFLQNGMSLRNQQFLGPLFVQHYSPYLGVSSTNKVSQAKIHGGYPVPEGLVPFMTFILVKEKAKNSLCGGTLITPRHILTAAHCIRNMQTDPIDIQVIINSTTWKDPPETAIERGVIAVKSHELFKMTSGGFANGYDVAILTLDKKVTKVKPVKLASCSQTTAIEGYKTAFATGWGRTETGNISSDLLGTVLILLSNEEYNKLNEKIFGGSLINITGTQISAIFFPGGRGPCNGDSGGPLMVGNQKDGFLQIGIVSGGEICAAWNIPSIYARVSRFFDWINLNTGALIE